MSAKKKKSEWAKPSERLPAVTQAKHALEMLERMRAQAERQRRLLWLAVVEAGGRVEIREEDFRMALQGPPADYYVQSRPEMVYDPVLGTDVQRIVLVLVDEEGNLDPRSEAKRIISTER